MLYSFPPTLLLPGELLQNHNALYSSGATFRFQKEPIDVSIHLKFCTFALRSNLAYNTMVDSEKKVGMVGYEQSLPSPHVLRNGPPDWGAYFPMNFRTVTVLHISPVCWSPHTKRPMALHTSVQRSLTLHRSLERELHYCRQRQGIGCQRLGQTLTPHHRTKLTVAGYTQWYCTKALHIPNLNLSVHIPVFWSEANAKPLVKTLVTNRTHWEAHRIRTISM